eukprot:355085-Rhodomonas_salina.4
MPGSPPELENWLGSSRMLRTIVDTQVTAQSRQLRANTRPRDRADATAGTAHMSDSSQANKRRQGAGPWSAG